jgi:hypothetical protein
MMDNERRLDWRPRHDERSRSFAIRSVTPVAPPRRTKLWRPGQILNQGFEGACVGFGWTAEALGSPVRVDLNRIRYPHVPSDPDQFARYVYRGAKEIDEWEGSAYEGTSVLAGAKIMKAVGLLREYRWAFHIEDVIDTLMVRGPVVIGVWWYDGMYDAPDGYLRISGPVVGGHCLVVVGYALAGATVAGIKNNLGEDAFVLQNSWGPEWGEEGLALIRASDLRWLLEDEGEACVPYKRSYGRQVAPQLLV